MPDITVNYKGVAITTMSASGTKSLLTSGKYCEDDIEIVYVSPGGTGNTLSVDLASFYQWEIGAVNGATGNTYDASKTANTARLRGSTLIKTNNIPFTLSANWGGGEWVVQYARYDSNQKGASGFTLLTSDSVISATPYIAIVCRHSDGSTAMNVSDIVTIAPKLSIDVTNMGLAFE